MLKIVFICTFNTSIINLHIPKLKPWSSHEPLGVFLDPLYKFSKPCPGSLWRVLAPVIHAVHMSRATESLNIGLNSALIFIFFSSFFFVFSPDYSRVGRNSLFLYGVGDTFRVMKVPAINIQIQKHLRWHLAQTRKHSQQFQVPLPLRMMASRSFCTTGYTLQLWSALVELAGEVPASHVCHFVVS